MNATLKQTHTIRPLLADDLTSVVKLERVSQIMPWSRLLFEEALTANNICRVVEFKQTVQAFHICCCVLDELHVLNLAVLPSSQGNGLGHLIMDDIIRQAELKNSKKIFLEVRQSNSIAQSLYQKWGFELLSTRKNYYRLPNSKDKEHALVYLKQLIVNRP